MGLRAKDKSRLSTGAMEQSLPDKLTQALRNLRPGALVHSASSSAAHSSTVVDVEGAAMCSEMKWMRNRQVLEARRIVDTDPHLAKLVERTSAIMMKFHLHVSNGEAFLEQLEDYSWKIFIVGISHKTTTVVYVNGESSQAEEHQVMKAHGATHTALDSHILRFGVICKDTICPFDEKDLLKLLYHKSLPKDSHCFDVTHVPMLIDMLLNTLEMITDHIQRLSINSAKATVENVTTSTKIVFPLEVSWPCIKAANQAMALYSVSGQGALRRSMSQRASLHLSIGRMFHWLVTKLPNKPMSESVPVYLTAVLERAMEEMLRPVLQLGRKYSWS
ncbi:unnamed protein product [Strongylus vulgaris]|uniref:ABTB2/3 histone-like domain-containing protein n=1 Tax=Strongylus vulgaris TaxID=40348 RepID=A0A3P7KXC3_STRVU|nr:unnamed protein product [Strongylus vulgaris]